MNANALPESLPFWKAYYLEIFRGTCQPRSTGMNAGLYGRSHAKELLWTATRPWYKWLCSRSPAVGEQVQKRRKDRTDNHQRMLMHKPYWQMREPSRAMFFVRLVYVIREKRTHPGNKHWDEKKRSVFGIGPSCPCFGGWRSRSGWRVESGIPARGKAISV